MNLKISDYGAIEKADIKIKRINVVGGLNNSGKTTASKLLYCHVKSELTGRPVAGLMENEGLKDAESVEFTGRLDVSEIFFIESF